MQEKKMLTEDSQWGVSVTPLSPMLPSGILVSVYIGPHRSCISL